MSSVIFKTHVDILRGVLVHAKHALQVRPKLAPGDTIFVAQTLQTLPRGEKQIGYRMTFVEVYEDLKCESDCIWGHHWRYIIKGEALKVLRRPFNIAELPMPSKNYGQGGPIVYVHPRDEESLRKGGYFDSVVDA